MQEGPAVGDRLGAVAWAQCDHVQCVHEFMREGTAVGGGAPFADADESGGALGTFG